MKHTVEAVVVYSLHIIKGSLLVQNGSPCNHLG